MNNSTHENLITQSERAQKDFQTQHPTFNSMHHAFRCLSENEKHYYSSSISSGQSNKNCNSGYVPSSSRELSFYELQKTFIREYNPRKFLRVLRKMTQTDCITHIDLKWHHYLTHTSCEEILTSMNYRQWVEVQIKMSLGDHCISHHVFAQHLSDLEKLNQHEYWIHHFNKLTKPLLWPCPSGTLPVLWSPVVVGMLWILAIRFLESDSYGLKGQEQLKDIWLPCAVNITENPDLSFDDEGQQICAKPLLSENKWSPSFQTRQTAAHFGQPVTGNAKRLEGFLPAFCSPHPIEIQPEKSVSNLLKSLNWGVFASAIEIPQIQSIYEVAPWRLASLFLIHEGQLGDALEPTVFEGSLADILSSIHYYDNDMLKTQIPCNKQGLSFPLSITCPSALSEKFLLPGTTSIGSYWK